jgi:hypothetical protein
MPKGRYTVGGKGTHGCSGYPVVGDTGKVHGCHTTLEAAQAQQAAIYASEAAQAKKSADETEVNGKRKKEKHGPMHKSMSIVSDHPDCQGFGIVNEGGELISCHKTRADAENAVAQHESQDTESSDPNHDMNNVNKSWGGAFSPIITKASKPNYGNIIKPRKGSPADKELYARVIAEAKRKFEVYPSAVANAWVVAEYKRRGGKYSSN